MGAVLIICILAVTLTLGKRLGTVLKDVPFCTTRLTIAEVLQDFVLDMESKYTSSIYHQPCFKTHAVADVIISIIFLAISDSA